TKADFVLVEIGGTVGEYENLLFLETARIMKLRMPGKILFMLVSYIPIPKMVGEMKTKPTQHAVRSLNYAGIQPDVIIARSSRPLDEVRKNKISNFCNVAEQDVISAPDIEGSIYEIPVNFEKDNLGRRILKKFGLTPNKRNFRKWNAMVAKIKSSTRPVKIGIVGKYFNTGDFVLADSYLSVIEAVKHAAWSLGRKPEITWLDAEQYEKNPKAVAELANFDGIIVPGGFGKRGVEGKIRAINFARTKNIPFLGLCYGLQLAVIEFARNVCKLSGAHTTEVEPKTSHPVICTMAEQIEKLKEKKMGGSMRLGAYPCKLHPESASRKLYGADKIFERHRHRYEVNNDYIAKFQNKGLLVAGV
ncbi:MAG: CTP synthase, partial [Patescibacteria group bacterium]